MEMEQSPLELIDQRALFQLKSHAMSAWDNELRYWGQYELIK
jgi:hypothetical protein